MRYFIDTNTFIFLCREPDKISREVKKIIEDCENQFIMSVESVREALMLGKNGKVKELRSYDDIKAKMDEFGITIRHTADSHLETLSRLTPAPSHSDPADLMIISQAITEDLPLISSDKKFPFYRKQGLKFIPNKR